jgi:DNA-binding XRE family transcriptional regulator
LILGGDNVNEKIATKIKKLRELHGYTQSELGQLIGVTQSTFNYKENGQTSWKVEELAALAEFFGLTIDDLVSDKEITVKIQVS